MPTRKTARADKPPVAHKTECCRRCYEPGSVVNVARRWTQALIIGLLGVAAYLPQCGYPFVFDDVFIIRDNPTVCGGAWLDCVRRPYWPREFGNDPLYRPVTMLSLRLNYAVFGQRAAGYRATNAVLHGVCAVLVGLLAGRLWGLRGGSFPPGGVVARNGRRGRRSLRTPSVCTWVAGVLFAVHPIHADAVALVVGRAELLAAVFALAVLYGHAGYLAGERQVSVRYHLVSAVLLLLAAASKEHGVLTLPAVMLLDMWHRRGGAMLADVWHRFATGAPGDEQRSPTGVNGGETRRLSGLRESANRLAKSHYLGMVAAVAAFLFARWVMFGGRTVLPVDQVSPFANPLVRAPGVTLLATPLALLALAMRLFVVPVGLCPIWSVGGFDLPQTLWRADVAAGGVLFLAGVGVVLLGVRRRWTASLLVALAGLFLLIPCHFVPAANWLFAERWVYMASAFLVVLVAGVVDWLARGGWPGGDAGERSQRVPAGHRPALRVASDGVAGHRPALGAASAGVAGHRPALRVAGHRPALLLALVGVAAVALFAVNWRYQQNWRSNLALTEAVLARHPDSYYGLVGYVQERRERGELTAAEPYVRRLVERFPDALHAWYYQALLMDAQNRPTDTLEAFHRCLELSKATTLPADLWAARDRARAVLQGGEHPPAQ